MKPRSAAYFDVDGTLTATSSVTPLLWFRRRRGALLDSVWLASLALRGPWWTLLYRLNNAAGNRAIYRSYRGLDAARARRDAELFFDECLKPRLFPLAVKRINQLKSVGVQIVFVTGGLDFILSPLADYLGAELIAPGLIEKDGMFTGELNREPLTGGAKRAELLRHAERNRIDLSASHAFGNEAGDAEMLRAVGHPVAINPERGLRKTALSQQWEIAAWRRET